MRFIDDKTYIPLFWAVVGFFTMAGILFKGAWWASAVNDKMDMLDRRTARIEQSLNISEESRADGIKHTDQFEFWPQAYGAVRWDH